MPVSFSFVAAERCNMCHAPRSEFRVLGRRLNGRQGLWPWKKPGVTVTVVRCRSCGLVFPDPMPIPPSAGELYSMEAESYWREEYFELDPGYLGRQLDIVDSLLGGLKGKRALDVGAGVGKGILTMRGRGLSVVGIEASPTFRALAIERMGIVPEDIVLAAVEDAELSAESFDFVNFGAVLEHLPDPAGAIRSALRWLRVGGVLHAEVPSSNWLLSWGLNRYYALTRQGFVTNVSPMHPPFHLYEFTSRSFEELARRSNCEIALREFWVADVYGPRVIRPVLRSIMAATGTGMQLAVWIRRVA